MRITQEALAHDAGTSSSYLSAIENGRSSPTLKAMERLAKALGVNAVYLLSGRISISIVSDDELEIGAILARPAVTLRRHPQADGAAEQDQVNHRGLHARGLEPRAR